MRGATTTDMIVIHHTDFNPRSPCGERLQYVVGEPHQDYISIHAPHAGSDMVVPLLREPSKNFNPRSPCGERRLYDEYLGLATKFQSTLPMRGATRHGRFSPVPCDFNPRSPCGERLGVNQNTRRQRGFQSTLPMRGATTFFKSFSVFSGFQSTLPMRGATFPLSVINHKRTFQSTLPMRGATNQIAEIYRALGISIHAPHAGSDIKEW